MKLKATKNLKHQGKDYRAGETFDVPNPKDANTLIQQGLAEHLHEGAEADAAGAKPQNEI